MIRTSGNFDSRWIAYRAEDARTAILTTAARGCGVYWYTTWVNSEAATTRQGLAGLAGSTRDEVAENFFAQQPWAPEN